MNKKPVLALETSGSICSASVYFSDDKFYSVNLQHRNIHAEKIYDAVDYVLKTAGIVINDLFCIAVSSGPGSFTGLRIGMSAAKGLAIGASLPVIPVPTFEAIALQLSYVLPDKTVFAVANKVNMDELYYARFQINANSFIFAEDLQILGKDLLGDKVKDCLLYGNAAGNDKISAPAPEFVAKYALLNQQNLTYDFDYLEPNYLKDFVVPARRGKA
jgi:tRNA threonylcarbamoyladenosine biosynthesis protein TsaB